MNRAAEIIFDRCADDAFTVRQAEEIAAAVEEALRGKIEQQTLNEQVRLGRRQGFCQTCGAELRD